MRSEFVTTGKILTAKTQLKTSSDDDFLDYNSSHVRVILT